MTVVVIVVDAVSLCMEVFLNHDIIMIDVCYSGVLGVDHILKRLVVQWL